MDSQSALKALDSIHTSSTLVRDCKKILNDVGNLCNVTLMWVPGHSNEVGNDLADLLARQGSSLHISWAVDIPTPVVFFKDQIKSLLLKESTKRWTKSENVGKHIWNDFNIKRSKELLRKDRKYIRKLMFLTTGHWTIGRHGRRLGIATNLVCPGCGILAQDTDIEHAWCLCPSLCAKRLKYLGNYSFNNVQDLGSISIEKKISFLNNIKWFDNI